MFPLENAQPKPGSRHLVICSRTRLPSYVRTNAVCDGDSFRLIGGPDGIRVQAGWLVNLEECVSLPVQLMVNLFLTSRFICRL